MSRVFTFDFERNLFEVLRLKLLFYRPTLSLSNEIKRVIVIYIMQLNNIYIYINTHRYINLKLPSSSVLLKLNRRPRNYKKWLYIIQEDDEKARSA